MKEKKYIRDKRSPTPASSLVSRIMSKNKAKKTKPELYFRQLLWQNGLRGYRNNYKNVPGTPDIAFVSKKTAIFVHGCYWHRCPSCKLSTPKSNSEFWEKKFNRNKKRDEIKEFQLSELGWRVIIIWECQLKKEAGEKIIDNIKNELNRI